VTNTNRLVPLLAGIGLLLAVWSPHTALADSGWTIHQFDSMLTIEPNGVVDVRETITAEFTDSKHGIYRDIPYAYTQADGSTKYVTLTLKSVTRNGASEDYAASSDNGIFEIIIGNGKRRITGEQVYEIDYEATGILSPYADFDELNWNVTGDKWGVPIEKASARVVLPSGEISQAACYEGVHGSTEKCTSSIDTDTAQFATTRSLSANEGMTVAAGYPKNLVPILTGTAPETTGFEIGLILRGIAAGLVVSALLIFMKVRGLRDIGVKGKDTIMPVYDAPDGLRAGQAGIILRGGTHVVQITATIVDLAIRGYLTIKETDSDYEIHLKKNPDEAKLLPYERELLECLRTYDENVALSELKEDFYTSLPKINAALERDSVSRGYFAKTSRRSRTVGVFSGLGVSIASLAASFLCSNANPWFSLALGFFGILFFAGIVLIVLSFKSIRRTASGHAMLVRIKGYKLFLSSVEKYRQPFFERQHVFMDILPYAIIFGVTDKLAKAFDALGVIPPEPSWYVGMHPFTLIAFGEGLGTFAHSFNTVAVSAPSSSESGGGGFSGGGLGGGGGGSW
jgi:Predicted membrane protein (DUF2207)